MNSHKGRRRYLGFLLMVSAAGSLHAAGRASTHLTLGDVLAIALDNAQPMLAANASIASAKAQRLGAIAAFLPSLSVSDQDEYYRPLQGSTSTFVAGQLVPARRPFYNNSATANFGLNLYNGGKDIAAYRSSIAALRAANIGLRAALNSTFNKVLRGFETLAIDQATVSSQKRVVQLDKDIEYLTMLRMTRQASSRIDLIQAQQQTLAAETELDQDRRQIMDDWQELANDIGDSGNGPLWRVVENLPDAPSVRQKEYPVHRDPAVQSAYAQLLAAQHQVDVARAGYWPSLSLTGQYNVLGTNETSLDRAFAASRSSNYVVGISLSLPLLPFYNTMSSVDAADANVQTTLSAYEGATAKASNRARDAFQRVIEARHAYKLAVLSARLAHINVDLVLARYKEKQSSRIDFDRALISAQQADLAVATSQLSLQLTRWSLYRTAHPRRFANVLAAAAKKFM